MMICYTNFGFIFGLLISWIQYKRVASVIISKSECGQPFSCPDFCNVLWEGACPAECRCNVLSEKCEEIKCPADPPVCIVYQRHDGCQDCACEQPYRVVVIRNGTEMPAGRTLAPRSGGNASLTTTTQATTTPLIPPPGFAAQSSRKKIIPGLIAEPGENPQSPGPQHEEDLRCSNAQRQEIFRNFAGLDAEAAEIGRLSASSLLFPPIFAYIRFELKKRCELYKLAYSRTSFAAKRNCFNDYDVYIRTYYAYSYACGFGTEQYFFRYFDCLQSLRFNNKVALCQYEHKPINLSDKRGVCMTYNNLMKCVKPVVLRTCGWDGWEVFVEYLSVNSKSFSRSCRLKKLGNRSDETKIVMTVGKEAED